jgi:hypothetical protein
MKHYKKKGGNKLAPLPYEQYGMVEGANSFRDSAFLYQSDMNAKQTELNTMHSGGSGDSLGFAGRSKTVTVPQFNPPGGAEVSPVNSNTSSVLGNTTSITSVNDAMNDCWATNTCGVMNGGKKRSTKKRSTKKRSTKKRSTKKRSTKKRSTN